MLRVLCCSWPPLPWRSWPARGSFGSRSESAGGSFTRHLGNCLRILHRSERSCPGTCPVSCGVPADAADRQSPLPSPTWPIQQSTAAADVIRQRARSQAPYRKMGSPPAATLSCIPVCGELERLSLERKELRSVCPKRLLNHTHCKFASKVIWVTLG